METVIHRKRFAKGGTAKVIDIATRNWKRNMRMPISDQLSYALVEAVR